MDMIQALLYLSGLIAFVTEVAKRIPLNFTSDHKKWTAVIVSIVLIGGYGYINNDSAVVVAQQVMISAPLSYVVYDVVHWVYIAVRKAIKK